ncbi:hypothetical protein [Puia dinghuensis]|uniref:Uncharacterized protein n=1 Tax=Puia dinghuensis TaxID=1792502 RepID=A0A8J2UCN2_9BACT|nr:hypothetical protein [Puia dinghuensis]GGA96190.1 hypothetical protein GCM10011511_19360 [Puia dinghuensis]
MVITLYIYALFYAILSPLLLAIAFSYGCKKDVHAPAPAAPVPLHAFTVRLVDTTTTGATITWTSAGDSTGKGVQYTIILDSSIGIKKFMAGLKAYVEAK